jgi:uncharacterized protein
MNPHTSVIQFLGPLITTLPAFTETMHLLRTVAGWHAQEPLWRLVQRGTLQLTDMSSEAVDRMPALMEHYADIPMDLADASIVALAEERGLSTIFTLDSQFRVCRLPRNLSFDVVQY